MFDLFGGNPAGTVSPSRFAVQGVYLPCCTYKITARLKVYGVLGFKMTGDGIGSVVAVSGALRSALDLNGVRHSVFEDFDVMGKPPTPSPRKSPLTGRRRSAPVRLMATGLANSKSVT